jgi:class 3 adenylate cyclase/tetratricopeptide (TPR) repeat protein
MPETLGEWLNAIDLAAFEPIFVENQVDLKTLEVLTEPDLKELGLAFGPRKRILNAVAKMRQSAGHPGRLSDTELLALGGDRRQLTVMFCDLVGSTALSTSLDPEDLHELIRTYHKTCAGLVLRYEGHVAKFMGDGVLAYFGWPIAHEDAAERGVRSALEIVRAVKTINAPSPLTVRIGLATGPVVVGSTAPGAHAEAAMVVGETPNLAARLQALAGAGEVVIAPATRRLLGPAFSLTDLGETPLKGFPQPVQVWRVDGIHRADGRFRAARAPGEFAPLVGRDEEAGLLRRRWQQACKREGQIVLIGGQAGIGKSRLVRDFCEGITEPHTVLYYQCSPYHINSPLHPFIEQFEFAAGFAHDDPPERKYQKLQAALVGEPDQRAAAAPLLAALHSLPAGQHPPLQLSPRRQKDLTLAALAGRIETLSHQAPVLMVVEDVHWIDPTSQELLELLAPRVHRWPVLLVLTSRLDSVPSWAGQPGVTTLTLTRLGRRQGAQIVDTVTQGRALPPEVREEILARTDGVPLFVEELTRSVLESGELRKEADRYVLRGPLTALAVPASLRDLLMSRLDHLGPVKELAQIGACIGREFSHDLIERISMRDPEMLTASLRVLVDSGLVGQRDAPPAAVYAFKHALVQDAAYDSLLKSRRSELHARIAQVIETDFPDRVSQAPEWLAHHHTQAGHLTQAIPLWQKAGTLAAGRMALKEAVAHLQKGLALVDLLPASRERDRLELTIREPLNAVWTGLRGWAAPEVEHNAAAILRLASIEGDRRSLLLAMWWAWSATITQGRIADSSTWVERLLAESHVANDLDLQIFGHATAMVHHFLNGRLLESRSEAERALALYDPHRAEEWIQLTGHDLRTFVEVYACQLTWMLGYPEQAKALSDATALRARSQGHAFNLAWALTFSAYVFAYRREPGRFLDRIGEADRLARDQGLAFIYEVTVPQAKGIVELQQGRPREAIPWLREGIERWTRTGGNVRVPLLKSALAEAMALAGDPGAALELIEECLEQIERPSSQERLWLAEVLRLKGWILMRLGRDEEAEQPLRAAIECARQQHAKSWELRTATTLAALLASQGRRPDARELLLPICNWFAEGADTKDLTEARHLLAELSATGSPVDPAPSETPPVNLSPPPCENVATVISPLSAKQIQQPTKP